MVQKEVPLSAFEKYVAKEEAKATNPFDEILAKEPLFLDKKVLQIKYSPETILHRSGQIQQLASILAPALRGEKPSNLFIYGKSGAGKTLCMTHILKQLRETAEKKNAKLRTIYLNCKLKKVADTEYRIMAQLAREIGQEVPMTGLPTGEVYNIFVKKLDTEQQVVILVLDEIDRLVSKVGDEILYNLTRINSELKNAELTIVGISNKVQFLEFLDARVKSTLGEEQIIFPAYNAFELKDILEKRAALAFKEEVVADGVLGKCAAHAAQEHGDARRALDLLRVAGELAERENAKKIEERHLDMAEEKIERDRVVEIMESQPKQSQLLMLAILSVAELKKEKIETGEVYEAYKGFCKKTGNHILTPRRISDLISELETLGFISAKLISKGRYGRTREIYITIPAELFEKIKSVLKGALG